MAEWKYIGPQAPTEGDWQYTGPAVTPDLTPEGSTPLAPDAGALETLETAGGNIIPSAVNLATEMGSAIADPVGTLSNINTLITGVVSKAIPGEQESEKVADAVGQMLVDRYGSMDALQKTFAEDPVGLAADVAGLVSGGAGLTARGATKLATTANTVGKANQAANVAKKAATVQKWADRLDPIAGSAQAIKAAGRGAGHMASTVLGTTSGVGKEPLDRLYRAGREGGDARKSAMDAMTGVVGEEEVVEQARNAVDVMRSEAGKAYRAGMKGVRENTNPIDFGEVKKVYDSIDEVKTFKGRNISKATDEVRSAIKAEIDEWGDLPAADFHTAEGLDALKQSIGDIMEAQPFGTPQRKVATEAYHKIRRTILKHDKSYGKVMKQYEESKKLIGEIEKELSLGKRGNPNTALRKLQSAMRNNVNTGWGRRAKLAEKLEEAGAGNLLNKLAGQATSSLEPRGLARIATSLGAGGALAFLDPTLLLGLPAASPRVVGQGAVHAGDMARAMSQLGIRPNVRDTATIGRAAFASRYPAEAQGQ